MHKLLDGAIILAIVPWYLYGAGSASSNALYRALGLSPDIMGMDASEVAYQGMLVSSELIIPMLLFVLVGATVTYIGLPAIDKHYRRNPVKKEKLLRNMEFLRFRPATRKGSPLYSIRNVVRPALLAALAIVSFASLVYFEKDGEKRADEILRRIKNKALENYEMMTVEEEGRSRRLYHAGCGPDLCGGIDLQSLTTQYFPPEDVTVHLKTPGVSSTPP